MTAKERSEMKRTCKQTQSRLGLTTLQHLFALLLQTKVSQQRLLIDIPDLMLCQRVDVENTVQVPDSEYIWIQFSNVQYSKCIVCIYHHNSSYIFPTADKACWGSCSCQSREQIASMRTTPGYVPWHLFLKQRGHDVMATLRLIKLTFSWSYMGRHIQKRWQACKSSAVTPNLHRFKVYRH